MDENNNLNNNSYTVSNTYKKSKDFDNRPSNGFGRNVFLPFISGIIGSSLVLGVCFGVPSIKEKIFGTVEPVSSQNISNNTEQYPTLNLDLVSLSNYSDTAVSVAEKVLPSIVGIEVNYDVRSFFGGSSTAKAQGSGIIISEDGYILTNNHIISTSSSSYYYEVSQANSISVYLYNDSTAYPATIVGTDAETDLAVIKIEKTGLTKADLGDSSKTKVGEFTMAIGNPLGMQSSISCGVVSALNRELEDSDGKLYTLIQTDAAINSGNSGGALVNSKGEVIGINTMKVSGAGVEGLGFAIPVDEAKPIFDDLINHGYVKGRPVIGITGKDISADLAKYYNYPEGVFVEQIMEGSGAAQAGIRRGDIITKVDGKRIKTIKEINALRDKKKAGDKITLELDRSGQIMTVDVILGEEKAN